MAKSIKSRIPEILRKFEKEILEDWTKEQLSAVTFRPDLMKEGNLRLNNP